MELDPGKLTVIAVLVSHWFRSWLGSDHSDLGLLRSELAAVRIEILRAEQTVKAANSHLENCLSNSFFQSLIIKAFGIALIQLFLIGALFWAYRTNCWRKVVVEPPVLIEQQAIAVSPVSSCKNQEISKPAAGIAVRPGPLRPSDLKKLVDQHGQSGQ